MPNKAASMYKRPETNPHSSGKGSGSSAVKAYKSAQPVPTQSVKPNKSGKSSKK